MVASTLKQVALKIVNLQLTVNKSYKHQAHKLQITFKEYSKLEMEFTAESPGITGISMHQNKNKLWL